MRILSRIDRYTPARYYRARSATRPTSYKIPVHRLHCAGHRLDRVFAGRRHTRRRWWSGIRVSADDRPNCRPGIAPRWRRDHHATSSEQQTPRLISVGPGHHCSPIVIRLRPISTAYHGDRALALDPVDRPRVDARRYPQSGCRHGDYRIYFAFPYSNSQHDETSK